MCAFCCRPSWRCTISVLRLSCTALLLAASTLAAEAELLPDIVISAVAPARVGTATIDFRVLNSRDTSATYRVQPRLRHRVNGTSEGDQPLGLWSGGSQPRDDGKS